EPGKVGKQWKIDREGNRIPLSGNLSLSMEAGEAIEIETPGGGGFGG
ncbi:MAG: 5-oxoprolinase (ATP-hydrolyzing), partial [Candidatus Pelagisphaera sp.]